MQYAKSIRGDEKPECRFELTGKVEVRSILAEGAEDAAGALDDAGSDMPCDARPGGVAADPVWDDIDVDLRLSALCRQPGRDGLRDLKVGRDVGVAGSFSNCGGVGGWCGWCAACFDRLERDAGRRLGAPCECAGHPSFSHVGPDAKNDDAQHVRRV